MASTRGHFQKRVLEAVAQYAPAHGKRSLARYSLSFAGHSTGLNHYSYLAEARGHFGFLAFKSYNR